MKTFLASVAGLVVALILIELGMRTVGRGLLAAQEIRNEIRSDDAQKLRIITLGESTTADHWRSANFSWPRQLEEKLARKGLNVRVYNLAHIGITTTTMLERLPEQIDHFHPDIVISMMGINDFKSYVSPDTSWWSHLRIVKLFWWFSVFWRRPDAEDLIPEDFLPPGETEQILADLKSRDKAAALWRLENETKKLDESRRARYYLYLAKAIDDNAGGFSKEILFELTRRSLLARIRSGPLLDDLIDYLGETGGEDRCLELAEKYAGKGWSADTRLMAHFSACAERSYRTRDPSNSRWANVLKRIANGSVVEETIYAGQLTERNYLAVNSLLSEKKIAHIAMQYPTLPVQILKDYFARETREVTFVDNRPNFEAALMRNSYDDLFIDRFGGTFGHETYLGHSIIADAAAAAVLEVYRRGKRF